MVLVLLSFTVFCYYASKYCYPRPLPKLLSFHLGVFGSNKFAYKTTTTTNKQFNLFHLSQTYFLAGEVGRAGALLVRLSRKLYVDILKLISEVGHVT